MFSRLTLSLYAASLLQFVAVIASVALAMLWVFHPAPTGEAFAVAAIEVEQLGPLVDRPRELQQAMQGVTSDRNVELSIHDLKGRPVAVAGGAPQYLLPASEAQAVLSQGSYYREKPPYFLALRLGPVEAPRGIAMLRRVPPPWPVPPPLIVGAVAMALIAAAGSVLLTRLIARPLSSLAAAARRFGSGDLGARVAMRRNDEFGDVASAFDEMAERVALSIRSQKELLANVSHELRTPVARVRMALDLTREQGAALDDGFVEGVVADLGELERLVDDVLQMARLDLSEGLGRSSVPGLHHEVVAVEDTLEGAAERFARNHGSERLHWSVEGELPEIVGDAMLLRRALDNLLDNAAHYSANDAPVTLHARYVAPSIELTVQDQGIGIAPEHLDQVGTLFFRTDRSRARNTGGVGLGLSLARRIFEAHGGSLSIVSELHKGTTISILLPVPETSARESVTGHQQVSLS